MIMAITRQVSPGMNRCELTHLSRVPIDIELAYQQHLVYEEALTALGCQVYRLPADPELPDSVFVEDIAIVFDEIAIITRPGAVSRRPETTSVASALIGYRPMSYIHSPGRIDGGDVLVIGKNVFVGISSRTNKAALRQMQDFLAPYGYQVTPVRVSGFLHLKSAVTLLTDNTLLLNPAWIDGAIFGDIQTICVDPDEPYGANALRIGDGVVYPANFPRTQRRIANLLNNHGKRLIVVDVSELQKAEGAVTCCSLIIPSSEP